MPKCPECGGGKLGREFWGRDSFGEWQSFQMCEPCRHVLATRAARDLEKFWAKKRVAA